MISGSKNYTHAKALTIINTLRSIFVEKQKDKLIKFCKKWSIENGFEIIPKKLKITLT